VEDRSILARSGAALFAAIIGWVVVSVAGTLTLASALQGAGQWGWANMTILGGGATLAAGLIVIGRRAGG
jgi:hypothetical protein